MKLLFLQPTKNPDSSPASDIWERNDRDCTAKVQKIWNTTSNFSKKFSQRIEWSVIFHFILMTNCEQLRIMNAI